MSIRTALRLPPRALCTVAFNTTTTQRRRFITLPGSDKQNLEATRTLPYACEPLYELIADVDSYNQFVPYCSLSRVTEWSQPDDNGRRLPTRADLQVGWGGFDEIFTSRLRCVPGTSVEAISGSTQPGMGPDASAVFKSLVTRWTLRSLSGEPSPRTQVHLNINFQFTNPLYAAVSAAVSDKIAGLMVEAFEKQARRKLAPKQAL